MHALKISLSIIVVLVIIYAVAALELWTQVSRYQSYWNEQNALPINLGEQLYVALGDSTAQGIGASQARKGYVGLFADELQKKSGKTVRTLNFSKTGAKLSDALNRQLPLLEKIPITPETIITIEIGANDMVDFDPGKFENQMDELMGKLPKQAIISDVPYFGGSLHGNLEPKVIQANEIMYRLADKHGIELVPLYMRIKDQHNALRDYAADRFHPSSYNYQHSWAPAFLERL